MARQLLAHGMGSADQPEAAAEAMQRISTRVSENLRRAVGDDGYNALIARALRRTEPEHPALLNIRRVGDTGIYLDGIVASVRTHGLAVTTAALEALLAALVDLLSGLIGADMVLNLLENDGPPLQAPGGRQKR